MIDVEPLIEESLARLHPTPAVTDRWDEILLAARAPDRRRPRLGLALAFAAAVGIALVATPLGAAIATGLGDFSAWLTGSPGRPASATEQQAFDRANARSWDGFPRGTTLRELIVAQQQGSTYRLLGFRSGDSLCLRVIATGVAQGTASSCAPLDALRARPQPVLPLEVDAGGFGSTGRHVQVGPDVFEVARASVSFGIVADGVSAVSLRSDDRTRQAQVASDAFLSVETEPRPGNRVRAITATTAAGATVQIPFAAAPFDTLTGGGTAAGTLHGPSHVQRVVTGGAIGWLDRREPRGRPLNGVPAPIGGVRSHVVFGRTIQPDPANRMRVAVGLYDVSGGVPPPFKPGLRLCYTLVVGAALSGGCGTPDQMFARGPINLGTTTMGGGDQYSILSGLASDDVAAIKLFLGDGRVVPVPLQDNAFVVQAPRSAYPIRVVAYDAQGRAIGIVTPPDDQHPPLWQQPQPNATWTQQWTIHDAAGSAVSLWTAPSRSGGTCFRFRSDDGAGSSGCTPPQWLGPALGVGFMPPWDAPIITGRVRADVARVVIHYEDGSEQTVVPRDGFVLAAVPKAGERVAEIDGLDERGVVVATQRPALPTH